MKILSTLNSNPRQSLSFITEDKEKLKFTFYFLPTQQGWFFDVESDAFSLYGTRLCTHPNLLTKYHNIINWGLNVQTTDGYDPYQITDFTDSYCLVGILNSSEVDQVENYLNGQV